MSVSICGSPPIFLDNKYTKWYLELVATRIENPSPDYDNNHHIWPKGTDGPDKTKHMVRFTLREHFIAHHLLTKMVTGSFKRNMCCSLGWFTADKDDPNRKLTARQYEIAQKALKVCWPFYALYKGEYIAHHDFYRFCTHRKLSRGNIQAGMKKGIYVTTHGKHKGDCFAWEDVGIEAMEAEREAAIARSHEKRSKATAETHSSRPVTARRHQRTEIELRDPAGTLHWFNTLTEASKMGPSGTLQNVKNKLPHTFKSGAWSGWTLVTFCTSFR